MKDVSTIFSGGRSLVTAGFRQFRLLPGRSPAPPEPDRSLDRTPAESATPGRIDRRKFLYAGTAAAVVLGGPSFKAAVTGPLLRTRAAATDPATIGQWTAPFSLQIVAIHSVMLHTGQVLIFQPPKNTVGSAAQLWDPVSGSLTNVSLDYQRDIFCAGQSVLSDGRVFIAGGHLYQGVYGNGVANTTLFDPSSNAFTEGPTMSAARWYPTSAQLADGTIRVFGGTSTPNVNVSSVEAYDPASNTMTTLPASASKNVATYPRMKLTTTGLLAWTNEGRTYFFHPSSSTWTSGPKLNSGGRGVTDTSVLLPGLTKIMEIGGSSSGVPLNTAEILDTSSGTLAWQYTGAMHYPRRWANSVLLADGTVLEVGGGTSGSYSSPILTAELYDPVSAGWTDMAAQTAPRMYHSTAVLLPDGRVLSAGQTQGHYQTTGEIFSPPYLFAGSRPAISSAPAAVGYGQQFTISTPDAASIGRVALIKASSVTHSDNFDQRYVDVTYQAGSGALTATGPPDSNHAPPGWYMLFILNTTGVPSVASWVQVG